MYSQIFKREWERKITFPTIENENGNEKIISNFQERESEAGIPGNGPEREFPLTPDPEVQKEGGSSTSQRPSAQGS